ncbi:MAG: hypothetical protein PHH58_11360, partial [Rhodoferax sp.]|nr:hypothetical protein [Rhodoferax sp.]
MRNFISGYCDDRFGHDWHLILAFSSSTLFSCSTWSSFLRSVMSRAAAKTPCNDAGRVSGHQRIHIR